MHAVKAKLQKEGGALLFTLGARAQGGWGGKCHV